MDEATKQNGWRFSKDIPISVVGFLILQAVFLIVSYVDLISTVKGLVAANVVSVATAYTKDDARKDRELMDQRFLFMQSKLDEMVRRISLLEAENTVLRARLQK